jgi:glycosyltransferase involved in cell wall biosynthesis
MIVRNEEDHLAKCLASVRGLFDELIIVDMGSTDRTTEIAREFGAKVFDFVWIDDFAAARNEALSHATGDYAFWLDADDVIEPAEREKLRALLNGLAGPAVCSAAFAPPRSGVACGSAESSPHLAPALHVVLRSPAPHLAPALHAVLRSPPPTLLRRCMRFCGVEPPTLLRRCMRFCGVHPPWPPLQEGG